MSDIQPPPGWWLASDGRWYAPELHPEARSAATAQAETAQGPPAGGRRALRSPWVWGTGLATVLMLTVLVVTGPGGGKGTSSAARPKTSSSPAGAPAEAPATAGAGSGTPAGAATPTSIPPAPAAAPAAGGSPGTASEVAVGPPAGDVSVSQCVIDPTDAQHVVVNGTVVNHDTHTDDYTITVAIDAGGQPVGSAFITDDQVGAGANSPWSALGRVTAGVGGDLTCTVSFVQRASS